MTPDFTAPIDPALIHAARAWMAIDPNPEHARILEDEISRGDGEALRERFAGTLSFGTAGLRAELGPGPRRMNRVVVRRTAAGIADYLLAALNTAPNTSLHPSPHAREHTPPRIVIGYDARHGSADFAEDSAAVVTAAGCEALLFPGPLPTPVLAAAVRRLDADAGIMVTASHNPPKDNGYKVYLGARMTDEHGRGVQITTPSDAEITAHIARHAATMPELAASGWTTLDDAVVTDYLHEVLTALPLTAPTTDRAGLRLVSTALHGVGGAVLAEALQRAGFTDHHVVVEQQQPDPDFPTVAFPNPEEPGAMDAALELAAHLVADLIIAHDPDADRLAVGIPDSTTSTPEHRRYRMLTGDEVGLLLGHRLLPELQRTHTTAASSIVSSSMLERLLTGTDVEHHRTLTGFKWIARTPALGYGYEEALGYCVAPEVVRDKDGIAAAVLIADTAAALAARGSTLGEELDGLQAQVGPTATGQISLRVTDLSQLGTLMTRLRATAPATLAGTPVLDVIDFLPDTDALTFQLDGARVMVRPSGTEPKLKCYLEAVAGTVPDAHHRLQELTAAVREMIDDAGRLDA